MGAISASESRLPAATLRLDGRRAAPTALAAALSLAYLVLAPPSRDLAAHLLRARLFADEGLGLWSNWWYGGHHLPGYGILFDPLAALLSPRSLAALAVTASAAAFAVLIEREQGPRGWLASLLFAAGAASELYSGRLTFALGLLPALLALLALQRRRPATAAALGVLTALASPVAALFLALAAVAAALTRQLAGGIALGVAALAPVLALALAFPEGGREPFGFSTLWPVVLAAAFVVVWLRDRGLALRAGAILYLAGCIAAFAVATPVGSNAARLGALAAAPLVALGGSRGRRGVWVAALVALGVLQWQAPVADVIAASGSPTTGAAYWRPLLGFLSERPGPPSRVEVVFTALHWESLYVAPRFPLARGWERQLDVSDDSLFYSGRLTASAYHRWLRALAVRYVALPDAPLDPSARQEGRLVRRGLPYLREVLHTRHWRVYDVVDATPIASGAARLTRYGAQSLSLQASGPGRVLLRVRYTPYWQLALGAGCVSPWGAFTQLDLRRGGPVRLTVGFSLARVGSRSPRCT